MSRAQSPSYQLSTSYIDMTTCIPRFKPDPDDHSFCLIPKSRYYLGSAFFSYHDNYVQA